MLTFLFWNLGGSAPGEAPFAQKQRAARLHRAVVNLAVRYQVDVLLLAEFLGTPQGLVRQLNQANVTPRVTGYHGPDPRSHCERIIIFTRFAHAFITPLSPESSWHTFRSLQLPGRLEILLAAVHFTSKLVWGDASQNFALPGFSAQIRALEGGKGHRRTVLVGDFNVNPFEDGMVVASGMNAVMTQEISRQRERTVHGVSYPFFYNPMWSHFGDATHEVHPPGSPEHEPPGACYYGAGEPRWFYWNMFDQVLLRPDVLPYFKHRDLRILVSDGEASLLTPRGLPDRGGYSDHLPLLFRLDL